MKDKKMILLSIIVCLIIILLGGTTAFFSQGQSSQVDNIVSTTPSLYYTDNDDYMKNNLIPTVQEDVIKFASKNSSNKYTDIDICKYNEEFYACSVYEFTIENTSDVSQEIITSLTPTINEYKNLYLMVVESDRNKISENKQIIHHQNIGQTEIKFGSLSTILGPRIKKTYSIILYIKSMDYDQTSEDAGKRFGATININSVTTGYNISKSFGEQAITVDLSNGLIPVVYNEKGTSSKWFVADTSQKWYSYTAKEQWWANAVSVDSSTPEKRQKYVNTDGTFKAGTEIAEADMLAMFVYIPRFSYTIGCTSSTSCYGYKIEGASNVAEATPGAIDIKFVSKNTKEMYTGDSPTYTYTMDANGMPTTDRTPSNWYTHPAFTFGDDNLSGIWVGKFETSVDPDSTCYSNLSDKSYSADTNCQASKVDVTPRIIPNVLSLVYQNVYNQFETAKKFTSNTMYGLTTNTDSHMMKNSEWGAVAYLSQSIYGKYGNANYEGANKEIYKNDSGDSWARYTGRSQGLAPATSGSSLEGTYKYNDIKINEDGTDGEKEDYKGTGASTTGNIYGIYDMSGGAFEYVMGYYEKAYEGTKNPWGSTSSGDFAKFPKKPENKYFDGYKGTISGDTKTIDLFTKSNEVIGHATAETYRWYSDSASGISASYPWVRRGDYFYVSSDAGVFNSGSYDGNANRNYSFRSVLATIVR